MRILTPTATYFIPTRVFIVSGLLIALLFSCLLVRMASLERTIAKQKEQITMMGEATTQAREAFDRIQRVPFLLQMEFHGPVPRGDVEMIRRLVKTADEQHVARKLR